MKKIISILILFIFILQANLTAEGVSAPAAPQTSAVVSAKPETTKQAVTKPAVTATTYTLTSRPRTLTLSDCYQLALIQSENIAITADLIKITEAHFLEALSIVLPHVTFLSSDFQQQSPQELTGVGESLQPKSSTRQFNMTETLFNGFKAIAAIKGAGFEKKQRTDEKIRAEQLLLVDVSNSFYLLIEERTDLAVLKKIRTALNDRVKELIDREKLGKSRPSEVVNAKTQLYNVEASIKVVESQEVVARQLLEFLVGQSVAEVQDTYKFPITVLDENYYLAKADTRPDVKATKSAWELAKENIIVADSDFLPEVNIAANYYTQRTGLDKGTDWDVTLNVSIPIFEGTEVLGRSKEANLEADESYQTYKHTRREAPYDIKEAYVRLTAAMAVHDAIKKSYASAKLNYHLQKKDYVRRLVNNLDVLTAIQTLQDAERNYIHALYEAKREYWQLRVATGQSGTESLNDAF